MPSWDPQEVGRQGMLSGGSWIFQGGVAITTHDHGKGESAGDDVCMSEIHMKAFRAI